MYNLENKELENNVVMNDYPKLLKVQSFMVGGLVSYEDANDGVYLLKKESLDKMMPTIEGRPVVINHQNVNLENLEDVAVGYVTRAWFNPESGQYDCEILLKDTDVYNRIKQGFNKVSSAYVCTDFGCGGKYLGQDYKAEILNGTFTHLAIVDNPRYPDAKILVNSLKGKKDMKLFKTKVEDIETPIAEKQEEQTIDIDGKQVSLVELVNSYKEKLNACCNEEDKKEEEKDNACEDEEEKKNEDEEEKKENACEEPKKEEEKTNEEEDKKEEEKTNSLDKAELKNMIKACLNELREEEKENEEKEEEEKKENRNAISLKNSYYNPQAIDDIANRIKTRADRIKEGNEKYSI